MQAKKNNKPNRLLNASSPYLLQHAFNPVDWYEWGDEALNRAKAENKPIFLSVGYSSCHWCHVMAHESFEDEDIAKIMNEHFISIKVDREERPDIDEIYMAAVQMLTGSGGWPMSVWLTPNLEPFYGGTYFPPKDHYGRPGFKKLLLGLAEAWINDQDKILTNSQNLSKNISASFAVESSELAIDETVLQNAFSASRQTFDQKHGGFGQAPKFPHAMELSLLLRYSQKKNSKEALDMVNTSLIKMANGGIYDQLGGGFHRYSTDEYWLAPHFEKMLYDQALLVRVYSEAHQLTGNYSYKRIVKETLDYVLLKMTSPEGGFYSAEDADSEGVEGKFYVWSKSEIQDILKSDTDLFCQAYNVSSEGNWEGHNILRKTREWAQIAQDFNMDLMTFSKKVDSLKTILLEKREKRIKPGLDDKVLTDWNGLMISAFVYGYKITGNVKYKNAALEAAHFIQSKMFDNDYLYHSYRNSKRRIKGFLNDYSFMIAAILDAYNISFDIKLAEWAIQLYRLTEQQFAAADGGYYFTRSNQKNLIARSKAPFDNAIPSGNSVMVRNLMRLAETTGDLDFREKAFKTAQAFGSHFRKYPQGYAEMLIGVDYLLGPSQQIVIAGNQGPQFIKVTEFLNSQFVPKTVLVFNDESSETSKLFPMVKDKISNNGELQIYVCENFTCQLPVSSVAELKSLLKSNRDK
jgi:uncharacterized protein